MKVAFWIGVVVLILALVPVVCMVLWNWLMPELFGLPTINYWQALGLMALASCFFYRGSGTSSKR